MSINPSVSSLIGEIYEATQDATRWEPFLEHLRQKTNSLAMVLGYIDTAIVGSQLAQVAGFTSKMLEDYSHYYKYDTAVEFLEVNKVPLGKSGDAQDYMERTAWENMGGGVLYREFLRPNGIYHVGGVCVFKDETRLSFLGCYRAREQGPLDESGKRLLDDLCPHVQRALRIRQEFMTLKAKESATSAALDQIPLGVVFFDEFAHPVYVNRMARMLVERHPHIKITDQGVYTDDYEETQRLHGMILQTARYTTRDIHVSAGSTVLRSAHSAVPMPVLVTPLLSEREFEAEKVRLGSVCLFIADPEATHPISINYLCEGYGLTKAEAQVAVSMANGMSVAEMARARGTRETTVRSQVRALLSKTNLNRQADLVRLVLTGPFGIHT